MDCSLREFLLAGKLGELALSVDRSFVLRALGTPPCWEGKSQLPMLGSAIWVYNSLEVVFTQDGRVDIIRLSFDVRHESQFVSEANILAPLVFTDINPCAIAEYKSFLNEMSDADIPFEEGTDIVGKPAIRTPGCVSKFSKLLRYDESVQSERPVRSSAFYLVSISTKT